MKISIAMATYNGADYIQEQLNSFLTQTKLPDELVITDDCSSDDTVRIIKNFILIAPFRVNLSVNDRNLGYAGNFNAALEKTTGDLIFLSDQDDIWFPEKIDYMTKLAKENPSALILMNDAALTDSLLNEVGFTKLNQIKSAGMSSKSFVMGCCCCIKRELLDISMPIDSRFKAHDTWLVSFANALEAKLVNEKVLQYYRRHETNESQFIYNSKSLVSKRQVLFLGIKSIFDKKGPMEKINSINQMQILAEGFRRACGSNKYNPYLVNFLESMERTIDFDRKRVNLRSKWLFYRLPTAIYYFYRGVYKGANRKYLFIRDIIGYPFYWNSTNNTVKV